MDISRKDYRQEVRRVKERLTDEEVFLSEKYKRLLCNMASHITKSHFKNVHLYADKKDSKGGWCDGREIAINVLNSFTRSFPNKELKNLSLIGILGHECGHKEYSNFALRKKYLDGIQKEGVLYPHAPVPENEAEREKLTVMRQAMTKHNSFAVRFIHATAAHLSNMLEDVYIEEKMCRQYPGNIRQGILLNRKRKVEQHTSLKRQKELGREQTVIILNVICQYALCSEVNDWDGVLTEYMDCLDACKPIIDEAVKKEGDSVRFLATNQLLLKIWDFIEADIKSADEKRKRQAEFKKEAQNQALKQENGMEEEPAAMGEAQRDAKPELDIAEDPQDEEQAKRIVEDMFSRVLFLSVEGEPDASDVAEATDMPWDGAWDVQEEQEASDDGENDDEVTSEEDEKSETEVEKIVIELPFLEGGTREETAFDKEANIFLVAFAREVLNQEWEEEVTKNAQMLLWQASYGDLHAQVEKEIFRCQEISKQAVRDYQDSKQMVRQVMRRLKVQVLPLFEKKKTRLENGMRLGRRMDDRSLYRMDGKLFQRRSLPDENQDVAIGVLIDMSGSMGGERIQYAKIAALCLYQFAIDAGIPICVYGCCPAN